MLSPIQLPTQLSLRVFVALASAVLVACGGGGGGATPVSPSVPAQFAPSQAAAPTVTVSSSASSVAYNTGTTITWASANTDSCISTGGGGGGTSGSFVTGPLTSATTYLVTCSGRGGIASQNVTVNVAAPVIANCATTGATSAITLSNVPTRTTGVAPLTVFFDATATTATTTSKPFHELEYRWNFGDVAGSPVSGTTWKYGSKANVSSRNSASGPEANHVYELPGVYTVSISASDGNNSVTNNCTQIVVQDPEIVFSGTSTICFSTSANYTNCPAGALHVQTSNFATAVNTYKGTNKRLLFRRGETFTAASASAAITVNGPGIIGAFGPSSDPKPIILRLSGTNGVLKVSSPSTQNYGDWRIMDLDINGQNLQEQDNIAVDATGQFNRLLLLRLNIHGTWRGVSASHWVLSPGQVIYDEWSIIDSTMTGIPGCTYLGKYDCDWRVYLAGKHHSIQGNSLDNEDTGGSHVIRSEYMSKGIISNNYIARAGIIQLAIKIHAWAWAGGAGGNSTPNTYSEQIVISDNRFVGGINPWTVGLEPQNDQMDERIRQVIVERNWFTSGPGTQVAVNNSASNVTIRNNIFNVSSTGSHHVGVLIGRRGPEPTPDNVNVYGNTFYSASGGDFIGIQAANATNVAIKNNLGFAPLAIAPVMVAATDPNFSVSSNSSNFEVKNTSPNWISGTPTAPSDFRLSPTSYGIGMGVVIPVYTDFFLQSRDTNSIGAVIQ